MSFLAACSHVLLLWYSGFSSTKLHVTIGIREWTKPQFLAARDYFTQFLPFEATCELSTTSLLKFEAGKWRVIDIKHK